MFNYYAKTLYNKCKLPHVDFQIYSNYMAGRDIWAKVDSEIQIIRICASHYILLKS